MKKIFAILTMVTLAFGCSKNEVEDVPTEKVKTATGKEIEVPTTTTYSYYSSAFDGRPTTYLLVKDIKRAELYRANDTLISELTDDEKDEFTEAVNGISKWNVEYNTNNVNEFEEIRKIAPEGESNIYRSFGSTAPAPVERLLKTCVKIAERLRREKGGK
jgi:hypothetical protein